MARFAVWAPEARRVSLSGSDVRVDLAPEGRPGWWAADVPSLGHGADYSYRLDGGDPLPDPRALWMPSGVHGPSRVYDHSRFAWSDGLWRGRRLAGSVIYEMHVGTFTPEGTFDGALAKLDHLVSLGIDVVEVMPVAAFAGHHGWGYDGVDLWAVHEPYGGPDGFKRFVDGCHARGLAVVLDVVYNHLGPSGNYLGRFGPYFTDAHRTPWGTAVNYDQAGSDEVRAFVIENALMWLRDYHVDGLRLDAVHAIVDNRAVPLLEGLSAAVSALSASLGRTLFLIAESDLNDPRVVTPRDAGGLGLDAQWNDDVHHALHTLLTGERQGYYGDFGSPACLAKVLTRVFFHDGTWSSFRGRTHGRPVDVLRTPGSRFLAYLQDHDQIGNRATGDRLAPDVLRLGAPFVLASPYTPMIFQGEEWGARTPWCYFTDHQEPDLADAIREGRRREFAAHGWPPESVPDPQDPGTFRRSVLDWSELDEPEHQELLSWYRHLIHLRRTRPELTDPSLTSVSVTYDEDAQTLEMTRGATRVTLDLKRRAVEVA